MSKSFSAFPGRLSGRITELPITESNSRRSSGSTPLNSAEVMRSSWLFGGAFAGIPGEASTEDDASMISAANLRASRTSSSSANFPFLGLGSSLLPVLPLPCFLFCFLFSFISCHLEQGLLFVLCGHRHHLVLVGHCPISTC